MPTVQNGKVTYQGGEALPQVGSLGYQAAQQGRIAPASGYYSTPQQGASSPTVISNASIIEDKIPKIKGRAKRMLAPKQAAAATNPDGNPVQQPNPDGSAPLDLSNASYEDIYNATYNQKGAAPEESDPYLAESRKLMEGLKKTNDDVLNSHIDAIERNSQTLEAAKKRQQAASTSELGSFLLSANGGRSGSDITVMDAKKTADIEAISKLHNDEETLKAEARQAWADKNYQLVEKRLDQIDLLRKEKQARAKTVADATYKEAQAARAKEIQSSRDNAVAGLLEQGVTDPSQILNYLNYDDQGNQVGDFTADEVAKALKSMAPDGDIDKLSGDIRDYFILKQEGYLPESISSLDPKKQLEAWMNYVKPKKGAGATGNKLTLTEVQSKGLPLSLVGRSEMEIAQDFDSEEPPQWFAEKAEKEAGTKGGRGQSLTPARIQDLWDDYRSEFTENKKDTTYEKSGANNKERALAYFKSAYGDALDDDQASDLADRVQTYVDGGDSYSEAVKKVIDEAS